MSRRRRSRGPAVALRLAAASLLLPTGSARATVSYGADEAASLYDPNMAKAMAALSKLAYCGPLNGTVQTVLSSTSGVMERAGLRLGGARLVARGDLGAPQADFALVAGFTAVLGVSTLPARGCVVAFRGTDNEANNVENSRHRLESWDGGRDHACEGCQVFAGYQAIWRELRPGVVRELRGLGCGRGDAVLLTGHNLGAGVMTLAMYSLRSQDAYDVQLSYNFESPRVGNLPFAGSFNRLFARRVALFRITHANDAVPHRPGGSAYVHVGNQVWYPGQDAGEYTVCANATAVHECGNDAISEDNLCPLTQQECTGEAAAYCREHCGVPPAGGPHCEHPLAPADNFCDFAGDTTEHMGEEFERSCIWGMKALMTTPAPTRTTTTATRTTTTATSTPLPPGAVACADGEVSWQPLDLLGSLPSFAETAADCQERCQGDERCKHFTFFSGIKSCHIEDGGAYPLQHSLGVVSGPRECRESDVEAKFLAAPTLGGSPTGRGGLLATLAGAGALVLVLAAWTCLRRPHRAAAALQRHWAVQLPTPRSSRDREPVLRRTLYGEVGGDPEG